jgi:hypothetical protein
MKRYELKYEVGEDGVFRMSNVENPAVRTTLVMFDDEMKALEFQDDAKQVIYSVAMRPNMLIPRKNINGEPAMVFYSEETVSDLQQNFFKNSNHIGATINHDKNVRNDMYFFESWIVSDPEKDKATSLGLQVQKGDWVLGQKIDNPEVWKDVKEGKIQGFSIEAYLEPVLTNENIEMTKEEVDARIKQVLMESQLGKEYEVDGKKYYIDKMEVGGKITDDQGAPIANAEITIDKWKLKAGEDGVIAEAVETEAEPPADDLQKKVDDLEAENNDLKAKIVDLEGKQTNMSAELAAAKKVAVEMGEEMAKGLKPNPATTQKEYHEMSNVEKAKYNRGKL